MFPDNPFVMFPDNLFVKLPGVIERRADQMLGEGEVILSCTTAKLGPAWIPTAILPGSVHLALTNRRLLGFYPSRSGGRPVGLMFEVATDNVQRLQKPNKLVLQIPQKEGSGNSYKTMTLSRFFRDESDAVFQGSANPLSKD